MYNPALLHFQGHSRPNLPTLTHQSAAAPPSLPAMGSPLQLPTDPAPALVLKAPPFSAPGKKWIAWNIFEISSDFWTKGCNHKPEPQDTSRSSTLAPLCALTLAVFALASAAAFGKTKPSSIQSSWRFLFMIKWVWLKCAVANCKLILVAILILICLAKNLWGYILLTHTYLNSKNTDSLTTHYPMAPQQPAAAPS